jgi:hypothetical protein
MNSGNTSAKAKGLQNYASIVGLTQECRKSMAYSK